MLSQHYNPTLIVVSVLVAIFASYTALDLANSVTVAKGRARQIWLAFGSLAMGAGIWSMHFVGMLAFQLPGVVMAYNVPLLLLSVLVAIVASAIALFIVSRDAVPLSAYVLGSLSMGAAIAGMHYIGIGSMRMAAEVYWNYRLVGTSILIAVTASFVALVLAFRLRRDMSQHGFLSRAAAGTAMGIAISGMHYTAMAAMQFLPCAPPKVLEAEVVIATSGLAVVVIWSTLAILALALGGSVIERALARRQAMAERVSRILESISDGFFSVDRHWRFNYVNRVAQQLMAHMSGVPSESLIGKTLWETLPGLVGTRFETEYRRAMEKRIRTHVEDTFAPHRLWFEAHAYPSESGLSVYFRDVTERKRNEQALQEAIRARDEFLSIASHELKTPLITMKLQTQMRQRTLRKPDAAAPSAEKLAAMFESDARQLDRLTRLIDDMLDISRINTGRLAFHREPIDLYGLTKNVLERFQDQLEAAGCDVRLDGVGPVVGSWDGFRLEQVMTNLLTNAMRYGKGKLIRVAVSEQDGTAVLTVRDQGIGIAKQDQERIFNRFERAVSASEVSGLGLGLYISRTITEMHGGKIRVESEKGAGATFTVELPLQPAISLAG